MFNVDVKVEHPTHGIGKINFIDLTPEPIVHVSWENGMHGHYSSEELEFVTIYK